MSKYKKQFVRSTGNPVLVERALGIVTNGNDVVAEEIAFEEPVTERAARLKLLSLLSKHKGLKITPFNIEFDYVYTY